MDFKFLLFLMCALCFAHLVLAQESSETELVEPSPKVEKPEGSPVGPDGRRTVKRGAYYGGYGYGGYGGYYPYYGGLYSRYYDYYPYSYGGYYGGYGGYGYGYHGFGYPYYF